MSEHKDDDKARVNVERNVDGWDLDVWFWGFDCIHVFAGRKTKKLRWQVNKMFKLVDGRWVLDNDVKDKWCIRHSQDIPGDAEQYWTKTYSPPGSTAIVERIRKMVVRIANEKEAARWRAEGYRRSRERRGAMDAYSNARQSVDRYVKWSKVKRRAYDKALALEKAFDIRGPRR